MAIVCRKCAHANAEGAQFCARPGCGEYLGWHTQIHTATVVGTASVVAGHYTQNSFASIVLAATELVVAPGGQVTTTATIHNGGSQVEEFTVSVIGPTAEWASVEPATLHIYPGDHAECTIRFAPPMHASVAPGRMAFTVSVRSSVHRSLAASATGAIDVGTFRALTATLVPQQSRGRGRAIHRVDFANDGNATEAARIQATDPTGTVQFALPSTEVLIAPGVASIDVSVIPPRHMFGSPRQFPFQLNIRTANGPEPRTPHATPPAGMPTPLRLDGVRESPPVIARWVPKLAAALATVAVVAVSVVAVAHAGPFHKTSSAGGPPTVVVPETSPADAGVDPGASPADAGAATPPTGPPTTPGQPVDSPNNPGPNAAAGPDPGAVGDLQIQSQGPHCDFIPNGSLSGGDEVSVSVHITWTGAAPPDRLVPIAATTASGDSTSLNTAVDTSSDGLTAIQFVPQPSDFGTTLQITITLDPDNAIPETDPTNNVAHVSFPLPGPRPTQALTDLPCSMS